MVRNLVLAFVLLWACVAQAQTVPGRFPPGTVYGNKGVAEANPSTITTFATNWTTGGRPGSPTIGQTGLNTDTDTFEFWDGAKWSSNTKLFNVSDYGAICDSSTNDTTAIQNAVTAWKASATVRQGINILQGPGLGKKCKVTGPIDFTRTLLASSWSGVVRDLSLYGVFDYKGPIGTVDVTSGGTGYNAGGTGNFTTATLTNNTVPSGGTGCTTTTTAHTTAGVIDRLTVSGPAGCGGGYDIGDTLNVVGAGGSGAVVTVATLSGGAIIDALSGAFTRWDNLTIEGDCTNIPNALIAIGRYGAVGTTSGAGSQTFDNLKILGCWKTTGWYNIAAEQTLVNMALIYSTRTTGAHYGAIQDGVNHFNWSSTFVTEANPIDTPMSFIGDQFNQLSSMVNFSTAATPLWISNSSGHSFFNSYAAGAGTCGAVLYFPASTNVSNTLYMDMHFETTAMTNTFCLQGSVGTPNLINMTYKDIVSQVTGNIFAPDANFTSVSAQGLTVQLGSMDPGATVFGLPTIWNVTPNRISVPAAGNYVVPSAPGAERTGGWICFGSNACTPSGGGGSTTNYLRGDGTWAAPPGATSGTVTSVAAGTGITVSPSPIIGAGTVSLANPSATTIGGVQSKAAVASQWLNSISTSGVPSSTQPAFTDISGSLAGTQTPAYTGDVTKSAGGTVTVLANIPSATPMAGSVLATNIAAPGTPAAGKSSIYVDTTNKVLSVKTDTPTVSNTVVPSTAAANAFATAISAAGVVTYTQPTLANISGVAAGANNQVTVYTGTNTIGGTANHTISTGDMLHGVAGSVVGSDSFANATSGTIKLQPVTGALGSTVLNLPVRTATATVASTTGTLTNGNCVKVGDTSGNLADAGAVCQGVSLTTVYNTPTTSGSHSFQAATVRVRLVGCGPGGGGGSGAKITSGQTGSGGAGGSGGACFDRTFQKSELANPMSFVIGTGGTGGTVPGAGPIAGNPGTGGTLVTCASSTLAAGVCSGTIYVVGGFGGGGAGGGLAANSASGGGGCLYMAALTSVIANSPNGGSGAGVTPGTACFLGAIGVNGAAGTNITSAFMGGTVGGVGGGGLAAGTSSAGSLMVSGASGGGSGGGLTASAGNNGAQGGYVSLSNAAASPGGTSGSPNGTAANTPNSACFGGHGGGGGYGYFTGVGTAAGTGGLGIKGSGGGGGGAALSGVASGAGGNGGNGFLCVFESI